MKNVKMKVALSVVMLTLTCFAFPLATQANDESDLIDGSVTICRWHSRHQICLPGNAISIRPRCFGC